MPRTEDAVSEVIGGVLLIALVLIGAAIVGTYVASQPLPEKIPKVQFNVKGNVDATVFFLEHAGGESLRAGEEPEFDIVVGGQVIDKDDWSVVDGGNSWSVGDRIQIVNHPLATSVGLVYTDGSGDTLLRSVGSSDSFYQWFPAPDPDEIVDLPTAYPDNPIYPDLEWTFPPDKPDSWGTFPPLNTKHVYVAAQDSTDFSVISPPDARLFHCDGVDDEAEINDAISIAEGGIVTLLDGNFRCSGRITMRADTTLEGQGSLSTTIEIKAKPGQSGYLPISIGAEYVNVGGFTMRGDAFVMVTRSNVRVYDIRATCIDLDGVWHEASGNGMFFVWVAGDVMQISDVEFYECHVVWSHTHGFNMNQDYSDGKVRATTNIRFVNCRAVACGYGRVGDPGVMEGNQSRSEWITGFDFHEWQDLTNLMILNCVASDNWESGFHLEPGARYTDPPGPRTVSKNIVFRDCFSSNNGQRNTYSGHFFMAGYYLSRDTHLYNCLSQNNRNAGYYVHGGQNSSFTGCTDTGSTYGWKVCKASENIKLDGCSSNNNLRWALWLSFSRGITVEDFHQVDVTGDRGYQNMLGWYKDEPKYQQPVTNSLFDITASGNTMPIINRAGSGNQYYLYYG